MAKNVSVLSYPYKGFYFVVNILGSNEKAGFQEVSGISSKLDTKVLTDGGRNNAAYKVPTKITYEDLVLKRGLMGTSSRLSKWCRDHLEKNNLLKVKLETITVQLLDPEAKPLVSWAFMNAYPIKWDVSGFNGKSSEIVIETLTLTYSNFIILPATTK